MKKLRSLENDKFLNFFDIVQKYASKKNSAFFLFCGEGNNFETETLDGEDLSGWLVPMDRLNEFEELYHADADLDDWADYFIFAIWSGDKNNPVIEFKEY